MKHLRNFFTMAPSQRDHYPAARIALGVALPLLVVLAMGRIDLTIYAAFGAFAGIYARSETYRSRFQHQAIAGMLLLFCIGLGTVFASLGATPWAVVMTTAVIAGGGSVAADYWGLRPGGSLFFVFAFAAVASLPDVPPLWQALLVGTCSTLLSLLLGLAAAVPARVRGLRNDAVRNRPARNGSDSAVGNGAVRNGSVPASPQSTAGQRSRGWNVLLIHALRYLVAAGIAGSIATMAGIGHSYWAMVAAVVPIAAPTLTGRLTRAVHRIVGTLGGVGVTAVILSLPLEAWHIVLLIVALQFLAEMFVMRHYTLALFFITPLALLMSYVVTQGDAVQLLVDRTVETVIGALVGVVVVVLMRDRAKALGGPGTPRG
ncbi:FUSC family protein [Arthrobacter sp. H14]|uniref:FUSC family protein n=1 Tax=Arthrobacter sp. H14 TaxID=1312959 RepID=UPI00047CD04C|nr:FUSC family protein [Arthrobacter sp. H14]